MKKFLSLIIFICLLITTAVSANDLAQIAAAGELNFGTASEYRPFVYYDDQFELNGLDIELIKEIGKRIGVSVNIYDMAFDGLIDSVNYGQVDLIGGAISRTSERAELVDFSQIYYENAGIIAASRSGKVPDQLTPDDIEKFRFGVQRGSSFDQWLKINLVGEGLIDARNAFTFNNIDSAMKALAAGTVDLVLLDKDTYDQTFKKSGKYKIVTEELFNELFAFAAAKDSPNLISAVNDALAAMKTDGTLEQIISKYTQGVFEDEAEVTITRPTSIDLPQPVVPAVPEATKTPIPPDQPYQCVNRMVYMGDVTMPDGTQVNPGQKFTKTWQIYNNGSCKWYEGYQIVYVDGDYMGGNSAVIPALTIPGTTVDVPIELTAPEAEGMFAGYFQLRAPDGTYFGPKLTARYIVTTGQVSAPPVGAPVVITQFQPNRYKGPKNYCPKVSWNVRNSNDIDLVINNKPYYHTGEPSGTIEMCPPGKGEFVYGIIARGSKNASVVFTYTNTGENKQ